MNVHHIVRDLTSGRLKEEPMCCPTDFVILTDTGGNDFAVDPSAVASVSYSKALESIITLKYGAGTQKVVGSVADVVAALTA